MLHLLTLSLLLSADVPKPAPPKPVSFYKNLRPILQRSCQGCHQPAKQGGGIVLTRHAFLLKGGKNGPSLTPGKPDQGTLLASLLGKDTALMPKNADPLPPEQIDLFRRWIVEGARDDTPPALADSIDVDHPPVYAGRPLVTAMAFSPDGATLAVGGYREILLHQADGAKLLHRLIGLSQRIESLAYSPDGKSLAAVGGSPGRFGELQIWDVATNKLRLSTMPARDTLFGVAWSHDGKRVAFGVADNSARILDAATGKQLLRVDHHTDWVLGAAFSLDDKNMITVGRDRAVKLTQTETGAFIDNITSITPNALTGGVESIQRHPTLDQVAVGGVDTPPKIYRIFRTQARQIGDDFNLIRAFESLPVRVSCVRFNADGSLLGAAGMGEVRVFQVSDSKRLALVKFDGGVYTLAFHPKNNTVAAGGYEGVVRIFEARTGKVLRSFVPVPLANAGLAGAGKK